VLSTGQVAQKLRSIPTCPVASVSSGTGFGARTAQSNPEAKLVRGKEEAVRIEQTAWSLMSYALFFDEAELLP